jgi:hypothetical protein
MFWIVLAAQLSAPQPIKYPHWFSLDDNPAYLVTSKGLIIRAVVRPDGALQGCEIEASSGDQRLDSFTCRLVTERARYSHARWIDGSPAYGVDRMRVIWGVGDPPPLRADVETTVEQLPKGVHSPVGVHVMFAADETGQPLSCSAAAPRVASMPEENPRLVSVACIELIKGYKAIPPKNDAGKPIASVQNATVRISRRR